jgi:adenylate cyclase
VTTTPTRGILFADLADSSRLYRELGDARARDVVSAALELAHAVVTGERGRVVDRIGDELFSVFDDGDAALRAAIGIQSQTEQARDARQLPARLAFRVGFICGPVGLRGAEVFGDSVYLAKRVANLAKAEQVLTSRETVATLRDVTPERFVFVERVRLKGRVDEVELVEALWGERSTACLTVPAPPRAIPDRQLQLCYRDIEAVVSRDRPDVSLGRSATCEIVVDEAGVSRLHARVEMRRDGFVVVDQSRNGTMLRPAGGEPHLIIRGQAALDGEGILLLGPHHGAPAVAYSVRVAQG